MTDTDFAVCSKIADILTRRYSRTYAWVQSSEIQQEAWLSMCEVLPRYDASKGTLDGYLYRAANNAIKNLVHRMTSAAHVPHGSQRTETVRASRAVSDSEEQLAALAAAGNTVEEEMDKCILREMVAQVAAEYLAADRDNEVLHAVMVGDLTPMEGAAMLGIKRNCLYQRTMRLRQAMCQERRLQEVR